MSCFANGKRSLVFIPLWMMICLLPVNAASSQGEIWALSLREADRMLSQGPGREAQLRTMGGITRFAGMVFDRQTKDVILIGRVRDDLPPVRLDDFVVALRARLAKQVYPRVSIDRVEDTDKTGMQKVLFDGNIENTEFGRDLLTSDVMLKRYSLDLLDDIQGVVPYLNLYEEETKGNLSEAGRPIDGVTWLSEEASRSAADRYRGAAVSETSIVQSRFWFHVRGEESYVVEKDDVYVIEELSLGVKTEALAGGSQDPGDVVGEEFARQFTQAFRRASEVRPELQRMKALFDLVAISEGIASLGPERPGLDHLLKEYRPAVRKTPDQYRLVERVGEFRNGDQVEALVQLSGGVELEAILLALEDGDVSALKLAVISSRPSERSLSWRIPLDSWEMPNDHPPYRESRTSPGRETGAQPREIGFGLSVRRVVFGAPGEEATRRFEGFASAPGMPQGKDSPPVLSKLERLLTSKQRTHPDIGGVMLAGTAKVVGEQDRAALASGTFSFVLDGLDRGATPGNSGKFVTALWSVYYSKEDPGISIDPIAWGADKQLVRYIGRVVNTDLGRVMREADYLMKKWAVGTEKSGIPGFRDVDEISGKEGMTYADAFRRFWFVPDGMTFKTGGGMFLFDQGRIALKTELMLADRQTHVVASDQEFADFFTKNYEVIAARYPIYSELFEYAKLVSIAKYLKRQGVPLHWYLLAHLDDVITEESIGAVNTLSKGSKFLKDVRIEGGVEMSGRYLLDETAAAAIQEAVARFGSPRAHTTDAATAAAVTERSSDTPTISVEKQVFSIIPMQSAICGTDFRGVRYQTDLAIRQGDEPGLELVRYFRPPVNGVHSRGEFGNGWHLLRPYRIVPIGKPEVPFLNILIPRKVAVRNLVTGQDEILTFDEKKYELAGYRPDDMVRSRIVGLFWTVAGGMRLVDKLGNEFWFNEGLILSEMHFSDEFGMQFEYDYEEARRQAYDRVPYRLEREGKGVAPDIVTYGPKGEELPLPDKLRLTDHHDGGTRVFTFGENDAGLLGYIYDAPNPLDREFIALRGDGVHILVDANGNEAWFNQQLEFLKWRPLLVKAVIQGAYKWNDETEDIEFVANHTARLDYEFVDGGFRVTEASVLKQGLSTAIHRITYRYAEDSMLASASVR